ncbi:hypothetical protein LCGC14_0798640 [marine sediment metagenome]|uniref:Uncharacterized protein n=1 Tax=marine sediment metagenome TaxID=412755 RepID=A0A0F9SAC6_9ZZZZ
MLAPVLAVLLGAQFIWWNKQAPEVLKLKGYGGRRRTPPS